MLLPHMGVEVGGVGAGGRKKKTTFYGARDPSTPLSKRRVHRGLHRQCFVRALLRGCGQEISICGSLATLNCRHSLSL